MTLVDTSCWCVGVLLVAVIFAMLIQQQQQRALRYPQLVGAKDPKARAIHQGGQHADSEFEPSYSQGGDRLDENFTWDPMATKATDSWNIPSAEGAKKGQTVLGGRLTATQIRPCRLPGVDVVSAMRPALKPVTMGKACISWGDSECRVAAIDSASNCLDDSPNCGISSR